jgi:murein DD-endopeptidase MepM/ murein hydrolase activator NlpD
MIQRCKLGYLFLIFNLVACTSLPATLTPISTIGATNIPQTSSPPTSAPVLRSTATFISTSSLQPVITESIPSAPTSTLAALQLFFPTVIPVKGAEYRPPLYPTPWALTPHDHFYFAAPIAANYPGDPESDYLYGGIFFSPDVVHTGDDIPAPRGAEVLAAGSGTVIWAGIGLYSGSKNNLKDPYGLAVAIRHDFGYHDQQLFTVYAHMEEVDVVVGQHVDAGEIVGHIGATGMTTGPHLHFEVRLGENDFWKTRNPVLWMSPPQGYGVLVGRITSTYGTLLTQYTMRVKSLETGISFEINTYGPTTVNSDDYYNENLVLGNLPAGVYELNIPFGALNRIQNIQIFPGQITFFSFHGFNGYDFNPPADNPTPHP